MEDLDRALARLAGAPVPAALEGIEDQVLARIGASPAELTRVAELAARIGPGLDVLLGE